MMCCTCQTSKGDPNTSCYMPLLEDIWEVYCIHGFCITRKTKKSRFCAFGGTSFLKMAHFIHCRMTTNASCCKIIQESCMLAWSTKINHLGPR